MPKAFEECVAAGGKVRTVSGPNKHFSLAAGEYMRVCVQGKRVVLGHKARKQGT